MTKSEAARAVADGLRKAVRPLTAEKRYHYFQTHAPDSAWDQLFRADDHEIWHSPAGAQQMSRQAQSQKQQENAPGQSGGGSVDRGQNDEKLRQIMASGTELGQADRERFAEML